MTVWADRRGSQSQAIQQLCFVNAAMQVGSARTNSVGEVYFIAILGTVANMENIRMDTEISAEVKHGQSAKDFLKHSTDGFTVEMK